jgi:hypothetical protein
LFFFFFLLILVTESYKKLVVDHMWSTVRVFDMPSVNKTNDKVVQCSLGKQIFCKKTIINTRVIQKLFPFFLSITQLLYHLILQVIYEILLKSQSPANKLFGFN